MIIMVSVGIVGAIIQIIIYLVHNKRVAEGKHHQDEYGARIYVP